MNLGLNLAAYGQLKLRQTIIGDENKNQEQPSELNQDDSSKDGVNNIITVNADALSLLAMQNKGLMNIHTKTAPDRRNRLLKIHLQYQMRRLCMLRLQTAAAL